MFGLIGYYVLHYKENNAPILAVVGSSYISVDEFIRSYKNVREYIITVVIALVVVL